MITFEEYENALKQRHGERIYNILSHSSIAIAGLGGLGSILQCILQEPVWDICTLWILTKWILQT